MPPSIISAPVLWSISNTFTAIDICSPLKHTAFFMKCIKEGFCSIYALAVMFSSPTPSRQKGSFQEPDVGVAICRPSSSCTDYPVIQIRKDVAHGHRLSVTDALSPHRLISDDWLLLMYVISAVGARTTELWCFSYATSYGFIALRSILSVEHHVLRSSHSKYSQYHVGVDSSKWRTFYGRCFFPSLVSDDFIDYCDHVYV